MFVASFQQQQVVKITSLSSSIHPPPSNQNSNSSPALTSTNCPKPVINKNQPKSLNMEQQQQHIDSLLERYLALIDEYARLREDLSRLQSGVYQNIARANFTGERGMRYGQDHYDERMRAMRALDIEAGGESVPRFTIRNLPSSAADEGRKGDEKKKKKPESNPGGEQADTTTATAHDSTGSVSEGNQTSEGQDEDTEDLGEKKQKTKKTSRNPLHWYGLLAPLPLRTAQTLSVQAVEQVIPRLASVNAEMEHVEIEIRRARKKRAKAAAVADKEALGMEAVEAR
ncbi:hypothetical protein J3F83DRAFT_733172 [Trichoderma novae-zelandiae]